VRRQAAYLRVSTPQQSEALQRDAISRAAAARGETIDLWFAEKISGKRTDRPELDRVRDLARRGEIGKLWVFRLDRLARGAVFLLNVVQELKEHGCQVVTIDGVDTQGMWAPAVLAVLGTAAEIELEAIRERTAAARAKAEAAGKRWGRPLGPSEDRTAELQIVIEALEEGLTLREASEMAGLTYGTAQRMVAALRRQAKDAEVKKAAEEAEGESSDPS
jgi:DNA invertase Pin-like site-specific DNA recombinase